MSIGSAVFLAGWLLWQTDRPRYWIYA